MKFNNEMLELQKELERKGHEVFMPIFLESVDYWSKDNSTRVASKKAEDLLSKHMNKIEASDAILVANYTKGEIENYIGANTFLEMGFAKHRAKKIYILNPLPEQTYIIDELESFEGSVLNGDLSRIE